MSGNLALEAWQQFGMVGFDPDERLHPVRTSLLNLVGVRAEESCLLDEHFRSLPPIIDFSNRRWYGGQLRIMTDVHHKRFGSPDQPVIELHHVEEGTISGGQKGQENQIEAKVLVEHLARMVEDPDYDGASIGVMCLFEEQVGLVNEMVAQAIDPAEWEDHSIVVVNPTDSKVTNATSSSTRCPGTTTLCRKERFRPARPTPSRSKACSTSPSPGHATRSTCSTRPRSRPSAWPVTDPVPFKTGCTTAPRCNTTVDSGCHPGRASGLRVRSERGRGPSQTWRRRPAPIPGLRFSIDLVCELDGERVALECDGELYHHDEHGNLRSEDLERQAILERAGWRVLRIRTGIGGRNPTSRSAEYSPDSETSQNLRTTKGRTRRRHRVLCPQSSPVPGRSRP